MSKFNTILLATALLGLGIASAMAGEDFPQHYTADVPVAPAASTQMAASDAHSIAPAWLLGTRSGATVDVYPAFVTEGVTGGGQQ